MQYSTAVNNARLDAVETAIGASAKLRLFTGAAPANCAAASTGTLIAEFALPADWMAVASGAQKLKAGTWSAVGAAVGTVGYFRILDTAGTACGMQGTCGLNSGELQLDNTSVTIGQAIVVTGFTLTAANQ